MPIILRDDDRPRKKLMKKPCGNCPYKKSTRKGFLTQQTKREGFYRTAKGMLSCIEKGIPQTCHSTFGSGESLDCAGHSEFVKGTNPDFISSVEEFKEHHIFLEGPQEY